jgi:Transcription factor involved in chromatin remodeling, contains bromodomain
MLLQAEWNAYFKHILTPSYSGRLVASYFEDLIPREGNEEYYRRIRMPLSLKIIEQKLHNQEFKNLSELESYFKRMVTNAKEFYPKNSEIYEDAERVRKALSNYMTKTNPAYKLNPGYSCQAAPIPDDLASDAHAPAAIGRTQSSSGTNGKSRPTNSKVKKEPEAQEEDAEGDEDAQGDEEQAGGDSNDGEEEDDGPRKIVIRRRGTGRPTRGSTEPSKKHDKAGRVRADHEYEGVPYKGLTFQQAQEKIVEELIRKPDGP